MVTVVLGLSFLLRISSRQVAVRSRNKNGYKGNWGCVKRRWQEGFLFDFFALGVSKQTPRKWSVGCKSCAENEVEVATGEA